MTTKILAAAAILTAMVATPVLAQDVTPRGSIHNGAYDNTPNDNWFRDAWDAPGTIVGGAVNTAGAIASAPFRDSYAYDTSGGYNRYNQSYAQRNGFVCQPGTWFRGEDGLRHICQ